MKNRNIKKTFRGLLFTVWSKFLQGDQGCIGGTHDLSIPKVLATALLTTHCKALVSRHPAS